MRRIPGRVLIVTAVEAERQAVLCGLDLLTDPTTRAGAELARPAGPGGSTDGPVEADGPTAATIAARSRVIVDAAGVGMAAAAASTARSIAVADALGERFSVVISAGIGGGFAGRAPVGSAVLASRSVAAELGADSPDGFRPVDELGFGSCTVECDGPLLTVLRSALPDAVTGEVLTLSTVTGTADGTDALLARWPDAVAEGMEGFGVATAAMQAGIAFAELRTISNVVGPRDRSAWRIPDALAALTEAAKAVATVVG